MISIIALGGWATVVWHTMPAFAYPALAHAPMRFFVMTKDLSPSELKYDDMAIEVGV